MRFTLFCFSLVLSFVIAQPLKASRVASSMLEKLGDDGLVSALDDGLRREVTGLLPKGRSLRSIEGQLLYTPSAGGKTLALVVDGRLLHIFRNIPTDAIDRQAIRIKTFPASGRLRTKLTPQKASHGTAKPETKAAPPPPPTRRQVGSTRSKATGKTPLPGKVVRVEVPIHTAAAGTNKSKRTSKAFGISSAARDPKGTWSDLPTESPVTQSVLAYLTDQDAEALAATALDSRKMVRFNQGINPVNPPNETVRAVSSLYYRDTELFGNIVIFPHMNAPPVAEAATTASATAAKAQTRPAIVLGHLSSPTKESWYHGWLKPEVIPDEMAEYYDALRAQQNNTGSVGGAGAATTAAPKPPPRDTSSHYVFVPEGPGTLNYAAPGHQESRTDEYVKGIFHTDVGKGYVEVNGRYDLSDGTHYNGTVRMDNSSWKREPHDTIGAPPRIFDGTWRYVGEGAEVSSIGHRLEGQFRLVKDGVSLVNDATFTLSSGASEKGIAVQVGNLWVIGGEGSTVRSPALRSTDNTVLYLENIKFPDGDHFSNGNAYQLPPGDHYHIGTMTRKANGEYIRSKRGTTICPDCTWYEGYFKNDDIFIPDAPTSDPDMRPATFHYRDGSVLTGVGVKRENGVLVAGDRIRKDYKSGASVEGTYRESGRQDPHITDSPTYRDPDGTFWKGINVPGNIGFLSQYADQLWPMGRGTLMLPDGRIILGHFLKAEGPGGGFQPSTVRVPTSKAAMVPRRIKVRDATVIYPDGKPPWKGMVEKTPEGWKEIDEKTFLQRMLGL